MTMSLVTWSNPAAIWQISPEHTASRLLSLVTLLRGLLVFDGMPIPTFISGSSVLIDAEECEQYANQVIAFYVASLPDVVGHSWQPPSLSFLARYWLHSSCLWLLFSI